MTITETTEPAEQATARMAVPAAVEAADTGRPADTDAVRS